MTIYFPERKHILQGMRHDLYHNLQTTVLKLMKVSGRLTLTTLVILLANFEIIVGILMCSNGNLKMVESCSIFKEEVHY